MSELESRLRRVNVFERYAPEAVVSDALETYHQTIEEVQELVGAHPDPNTPEGRLASIALMNAHERFKMAEASAGRYIEPITGLLERGPFATELIADAQEMLAAQRDAVVLYVVDLNNLKLINDTGGHDEGDRYLGIVGHALKRFGPVGYKAGRIGGDEIGVIEPVHRTDFDTVKLALDTKVESYARTLIEKDPGLYRDVLAKKPIGVAMGRGILTPDAYRSVGERPSIGELLAVSGADRNMYEQKRLIKGPDGSYR